MTRRSFLVRANPVAERRRRERWRPWRKGYGPFSSELSELLWYEIEYRPRGNFRWRVKPGQVSDRG